jgi:hypothetical protein
MSPADAAITRLRDLSRKVFRKNTRANADRDAYPRSLHARATGPLMEQLEPRVMLSATIWTQQFGSTADDYPQSVALDGSGNSYVAGYTYGDLDGVSQGNADAFLTKIDSMGSVLWTKQFGTSEYDYGEGVAVDGSGNIYVVGETEGDLVGTNAGEADVFIRKFNSSGATLWTRQFGTPEYDWSPAVAVDGSGSVYVVGDTGGDLGGPNAGTRDDMFLRKYNSSGTEQWTKQFGTNKDEDADDVAVDSSGKIYVTGDTDGAFKGKNAGEDDVFLRKFNAAGKTLWTKQFGTPKDDDVERVAIDDSGNIYLAGDTEGDLAGRNKGDDDGFLRKFSPSGATLWTRQFGTAQDEDTEGVAVDGAGRAYVVGNTQGSMSGANAGEDDIYVRKFSSSGGTLWTRQFGTSADDDAQAIALDGNGNAYVAGDTEGDLGGTNAGFDDAFLAKVGPDMDLYDRDNAQDLGGMGNAVQTVKGEIGKTSTNEDYNDWYEFHMTGRRKITATLTGLKKDANLQLCDSTGTVLKTAKKSGTSNEKIVFNATPTDPDSTNTYYLRVYSKSKKKTKYTLTVKAVLDNEIVSADTAKNLGTPGSKAKVQEGKIGGVDMDDWYKFTVTGIKKVVVALDQLKAGTATGFNLLEDTGGGTTNVLLGTTHNSSGPGMRTEMSKVLAAGTYYVSLDTVETTNSAYRLKVQAKGDKDLAKRSQAQDVGTLGSTTTTTTGQAGREDRSDWYKFTVKKTRVVTATLKDLNGNMDLMLYAGDGDFIAQSTNAGTTNEVISETLPAGSYYARVLVPGTESLNSMITYALDLVALPEV